jgi:hypothetical protein
VAALLAATYPAFVFNKGRLLSEPLAEVLVPGAVLAFLWALEKRSLWAWLAPGALIGASALVRPEYLLFGIALALPALVKVALDRGVRSGVAAGAICAAAFAAPIAPWAIHVSSEEGRFVPVTTGAGKALFIGSYLPGDGIHDRVKIELMERYLGMRDVTPEQRARQPMEPLLDRVAARYPDLPRDAALNRIGRENLSRYVRERPVAVARMMADKMRWMWRGSSGAMLSPAAVVLQILILAFAVVGLVILAIRRRFEALLLGGLILGLTVFSGIVLAAPRRNLALMPLVMTLASTGLVSVVVYVRAVLQTRGLQPRLDP